MSDAAILKSLREQALDESEPLVGLLRKCLALGSLTESDELHTWANNELKGYADDVVLPPYRLLDAPLFINQMGGNMYMTGQSISRFQIPSELREYVPEKVGFRQPIEELAQLAASGNKSIKMSAAGFALVAAQWTKQLGMFQAINAIYYDVSPSAIAGMVGMIRTTLVEIVIDMTKGVPLDKLPSQAKVDSAVQVHIGSNDKYQVSIGSNSGVVGQGPRSTQIQNNPAPPELSALIDQMRDALADIDDPEQRADAEQAIGDFDDAVSEDQPEPEKIKRRSRALERITTATASAALSQMAKVGVALAAQHFHLVG